MYSASAEFHTAVFANSPAERVLFRFADGTILTREDLNLSSGLKFTEAANLEDELTIGACPSSTIEATISNYGELLSGFAFGECEVSLGVRTAVTTETAYTANAMIVLRYGGASPVEITGHSTEPYLKVNGEAANIQPTFAVRALVAEGYLVYAIGINGEVWAATWTDGQTWSALSAETWNDISDETWNDFQGSLVLETIDTQNDFMVDKIKKWATAGRGIAYNAGIQYEFYRGGNVEKYEYVKLGTFNIDTPAKRKVKLITTTAYDRMIKFDKVADSFLAGLTYPITLGGIYTALCTFVGVTSATTTFINSTRSFAAAPATMENITAREILGWIAEAACSFARMTRDGELELAWFGEESVMILPTQHFNAEPSEYQVAAIDKLQIKNTENDIGVIIGTGTNAYVILDNPFLYGSSDTEIRTYGTPIYNRLAAFAPFSPINANAVCDWSVQAGDIISITSNEVEYAIPVYLQTITWKGGARVTYESTGEASRPLVSAVNRSVYNQKRAVHELNVTVDALESRISDAEGNISSIDQYVDSISLSVTNGTTSSTIKLMAGTTQISSQTISMSGLVTFTNLSTSGQTTINGSNITTGALNANLITTGAINASLITTGSLNANLITSGSINANLITTGTLSADRISTGTLTSVNLINGAVSISSNLITFTSSSGQIKMTYSGLDKNIIQTLGGAIIIGEYWASEYSATNIRSMRISLGSGVAGTAISVNGVMNAYDNVGCWENFRHYGDNLGFFGSTSTKRSCATLASDASPAMIVAKVNELIGDIAAYGLL